MKVSTTLGIQLKHIRAILVRVTWFPRYLSVAEESDKNHATSFLFFAEIYTRPALNKYITCHGWTRSWRRGVMFHDAIMTKSADNDLHQQTLLEFFQGGGKMKAADVVKVS